MKAAGIVNYTTELDNPRLAEVAAAIGLWARRVERPGDLEEAPKGFTLYAIRTILSGRGEELLDLVTTNVARRILR